MRRREFIGLVGGAAAAWPLAARAQQTERMRRIGVLMGGAGDLEYVARVGAFRQVLRDLGWVDGRNIQIDIRWGDNDRERIVEYARELVRLQPDAILAGPTHALRPLKKQTQSIPIVFVQVSDPMGQGIVTSIARPGGNVTGFSNLEFSLIGKYLQLLRDIAPGMKRAGVMIHVTNAVSANWFSMFKAVAPSLSVQSIDLPVQDDRGIINAIEALAREPNSCLIVPGDTYVDRAESRKLIIAKTAASRLPALYTNPAFVREGGLLSYAIDPTEQYRGAAAYVDRIRKGEAPGDLPVQQPAKFKLAINLRAARLIGLTIPLTLHASADEVIE
jgi:putative ABC transport system substrate-binding protein